MNTLPELDVFRWIGGIAVIFELLADEPLFGVVAGALAVAAAFLILYYLTCFTGD